MSEKKLKKYILKYVLNNVDYSMNIMSNSNNLFELTDYIFNSNEKFNKKEIICEEHPENIHKLNIFMDLNCTILYIFDLSKGILQHIDTNKFKGII